MSAEHHEGMRIHRLDDEHARGSRSSENVLDETDIPGEEGRARIHLEASRRFIGKAVNIHTDHFHSKPRCEISSV